jgi:AraC family transcriptional regulator of adaptative response/methylated-DNA-[protein]-cysteine methyltransferase
LVKGTDFQLKVWKALLSIPEGEVTSYAKVARMIGHPKSVRAVGTACGANKIAYLVPCHRVLLSQGGIGGYAWGIERKKEMLRREKIEKVS